MVEEVVAERGGGGGLVDADAGAESVGIRVGDDDRGNSRVPQEVGREFFGNAHVDDAVDAARHHRRQKVTFAFRTVRGVSHQDEPAGGVGVRLEGVGDFRDEGVGDVGRNESVGVGGTSGQRAGDEVGRVAHLVDGGEDAGAGCGGNGARTVVDDIADRCDGHPGCAGNVVAVRLLFRHLRPFTRRTGRARGAPTPVRVDHIRGRSLT